MTLYTLYQNIFIFLQRLNTKHLYNYYYMTLSLNTYRLAHSLRYVLFVLLVGMSYILPSHAQPRLLNAVYPYPSEEQNCLLIDKQGLV